MQTDDGGGLNIRSGPSVDSEAMLSVADGGSVTIINGPYFDDAQNGWYAVSSGDVSGFVYAGFLAGGSGTVSNAVDLHQRRNRRPAISATTPRASARASRYRC